MTGYAHLKWYYEIIGNFRAYHQTKNQLHPPRFSGDITKISKFILDTLECLVTHNQNDSINL